MTGLRRVDHLKAKNREKHMGSPLLGSFPNTDPLLSLLSMEETRNGVPTVSLLSILVIRH